MDNLQAVLKIFIYLRPPPPQKKKKKNNSHLAQKQLKSGLGIRKYGGYSN